MNGTLTVRLDDDLMSRLEAEARRTRTSKGEVVRDAIRHRLKRKGKPSAFDSLSQLRGIISGPSDLSTGWKSRKMPNNCDGC